MESQETFGQIDPTNEALMTERTNDECENCKIITDQYAYLKERLRK